MGLSCWLFAFILTNSKDILLKYTSVEGYYKEVIFKLKKFMKSKKINRRLRLRTISYLQFMKANFKKKNLKEQEILDLLSPTLREDIIIKTRGKLIQKCIVFKNYSMDFIRAVIRHLKHSIFAPNDLIIKEGDRTNSIFFILNGKVEIYHEKTKTVFVELGKKKYFGEIAFFLERVRTSSARSLVFSEILYLEKKDLEVTLRSRPKEVENHRIFITMAQNNLKVIGIKCYLCGTHGHLARDCKKFVILVNKAEIVKNADNKRYKLNKKVGDLELEEPAVVLRSRYSRRNSVGFPNNLNSFNENKRLRKMCKDYLNQSKKVNYKYKIKKEHFDESSSSDGENDLIRTSSVLPKNLQYSSLYFTRKSLLIDNSPESLKISNQSETNTFTFGK
jgi:CRP-like cAMP-binding protein